MRHYLCLHCNAALSLCFVSPARHLHLPDEADEESRCSASVKNIKRSHPRRPDSIFFFFDSRRSLFCMQPPVRDDRVLFLKNIPQNKAAEVAALWKQNSNVSNFFPLLNKVKKKKTLASVFGTLKKAPFSPLIPVCTRCSFFQAYLEFWTSVDIDRFTVWYNLLKQDTGYEVFRLKAPKTYKLFSESRLICLLLNV